MKKWTKIDVCLKIANVYSNKKTIWNHWRRYEKIVTSKKKRDKSRKNRNVEKKNSNENYMLFSNNELFENDNII